MNKKVVFVMADGFEEIEAVTPIDILRRLNIEVIIAGLRGLNVTGAHGIELNADCLLSSLNAENIGMLVLPGGMPGSKYLRESDEVVALLQDVYAAGDYVAAICAAPIALERAGLVDGKRITSHPSVESMLTKANHTGKISEVDGLIITGKGPGAAFEFALRLAEALGKGVEATAMLEQMFVK